MTENRKILNTSDLDGFDKWIIMIMLQLPNLKLLQRNQMRVQVTVQPVPTPVEVSSPVLNADKESGGHDKDDVFSDGEAEHPASRSKQTKASSEAVETVANATRESESNKISNQIANLTNATEQVSLGNKISAPIHSAGEPKSDVDGRTVSSSESEFKAMAADASVFTFGDDEDYESD
ncbi:hypothetical protein SESBI_27740 [Sesbania bispinosa]|nr:hypothetical protein SESBI_27740 [Sesbania bispinosa]